MTYVIALIGSAAGTRAARWWLRSTDRLDHPTKRSLHVVPTPRGGGIGPVAALLVALMLWHGLPARDLLSLTGGIGGLATLGLVDDLRSSSPVVRLAVQIVASAGVVVGFDVRPLVFAAIAVVWAVSFTNAFNFMDGVNGIAAGQAAVAGGVWWLVAWRSGAPALEHEALLVLLVALGFAPYNFPRASVFLGDVGSYGLGSALAFLALLGCRGGVQGLSMVAPLSIFVADTLRTLSQRTFRGAPVLEAHREHVFQRLVELGWSHTEVTMVVSGFSALAGGLGLIATAGGTWVWASAAGVLFVCALYLALPVIYSGLRGPVREPR